MAINTMNLNKDQPMRRKMEIEPMKISWLTICFFLISMGTLLSQNPGILHLDENKLIGKCENRFFSGFEIELDSLYTEIDSLILFNQLPRIGILNFKNRIDIPTEFTLTRRAGYPQIMFRFRNSYHTFDSLSIDHKSISFLVDDDPIVPVVENDLIIIQLAKKLLSEEKYWNKEDDRDCEDDVANKHYSIYCALRIASLEVEEHYNHRNAALQKLRQLIEEKYPNRKWNHRLMDYNNMAEIQYHDIMVLLDEIEFQFLEELTRRE